MFQSWQEGEKITFRAPCKINLHLSIGEKRPDGYHDLESVFAALNFADTLTFLPLGGQKGQTSLAVLSEWPFPDALLPLVSPENNLVCRAAGLFREKTGFPRDLAVELVKRVPPGSGLGGGSSDAAAALLALNSLAGHLTDKKDLLSREELMELAAQLGSDVPFFVKIAGPGESPACVVGGRGELLKPLPPPPPLGVVLAFPAFTSETAKAYELLDMAREGPEGKASALPHREAGSDFWAKPENWDFNNDFLALFLRHGKEKNTYRAILSDLRKAGAVFTGLSGSGSACFGIFPGKSEAEKAKQRLSGAFYTVKSTFFLHSIKNNAII